MLSCLEVQGHFKGGETYSLTSAYTFVDYCSFCS